ncbi:Ubiquitin carboxyl-terminal hydrolase 10 [Nymphon striatum]|nr:Ubiquitin carboxyl-terminal hydrolase 10 [Nymphon striatum]
MSFQEISFFDSTNLAPEELNHIKEILTLKKNERVKFPWDNSCTNDKKQDENGNNITQPSYCVDNQQPLPYSISQGVNTNVLVQPGMVPVVSDCMPIHSAGLTHVYPAPHFVGYPQVNHELMLNSHPAMPLVHPQSQGIHHGNPHDSQNIEIGQMENMHSVDDQIDVTNQPGVHHMPYSTLPQPYPTQSAPTLFYSPNGPATRGQPFFYIPVTYQHPSYPMHQNVPVTMAANHPCVMDETIVSVAEPMSNVIYCDNPDLYTHEHFVNGGGMDHSDNDFYTESVENVQGDETVENIQGDQTVENYIQGDETVENIESNHVNVGPNDIQKTESNCSDETIDSQSSDNDDMDSHKVSSVEAECDQNNHSASENDCKTSDNADDCVADSISKPKTWASLLYGANSNSVNLDNKMTNGNNVNESIQIKNNFNNHNASPKEEKVGFVQSFLMIHLNNFKNKRKDDLSYGKPFEPTNIHRMLSRLRSSCVKGRQEDAEEFLSCILDGIHEEMLALMKSDNMFQMDALKNGIASVNNTNSQMNGSAAEDDWLVIGGKNKGVVTRSANYVNSPISEIFGGQLRSLLKRPGTDPTANLEPFFTLQLDVQSDQVSSIKDALYGLVSKEAVEGFVCAKTGNEVEASRRLTLEELPPVLILHIKRFVYNKDGGCQKVLKKVEYDVDLDLNIELLSSEVKMKYKNMRSYKLFAVVYHDGKEAVKGHYITDAYHSGSNGWLRFDDSSVYRISESQVLKHCPPRVPYLLFYKRSSDQVNSINDALHGLVSKEAVEGFVCAKTGNEVEASRRLTLEELPPVLILHIKRFVYNKDDGCV